MKAAAIPFLMAVINVPFIMDDPSRWWNWASLVICFGIGSAIVVMEN